ncbi:alpha/beta-hydrolase [Mycena maculata]|uniref:Alpha/beta-hydrolase n=1 Tax=Mycena maculata TaxID=230809 RepID=A0AAD7K7Q3_9AGAR|nr:alpha/beta-hydrolase [Mycena maculata]
MLGPILLLSLQLLPTALSLPLLSLPRYSNSTGRGDNTAATTPVSLATLNSTLLRAAQLTRVAFCSSESIIAWTCGVPCDSVMDITVLQSGGNDGTVPLYYIAHDPDEKSLVVAHEGSNFAKITSILNDVELGLVPLNASRFPQSAGQNIKVHSGFQQTFERTADKLLAGVMAGLASTGVKKVLVTGHSLGAAVATMTGAMIKDAVDPSVAVSLIVFGLPRGGNQAWADFLDSGVGVTYMTNQNDPVPTVPPELLGFHHPTGEIHSVDATQSNFIACPGQDNENCSTGNSLLAVNETNHDGPYFDNITFRRGQCVQ